MHDNLTDDQVLAKAREALIEAASLEPKSVPRALAFARFDGCMGELELRAYRRIIAALKAEEA